MLGGKGWMRWSLALLLFAVSGCRCVPVVTHVEPARLVSEPSRASLPATYVGQSASVAIRVTNLGGATTLEPAIEPPFAIVTSAIALARGDAEQLIVTFSPTGAGRSQAVLRAGDLEVEIEGEGVEVPQCVASAVCFASVFDFVAAVCREAPQRDGTLCETSCVIGACEQGTCIGQIKGCCVFRPCRTPIPGEAERPRLRLTTLVVATW